MIIWSKCSQNGCLFFEVVFVGVNELLDSNSIDYLHIFLAQGIT